MAYDESLADRIREAFKGKRGVAEKKMFGGIAFMLGDNMCCGVVKNKLMVRVGSDNHDAALARPHAEPMTFTGKPMRGMIYVASAGCKTVKDIKPLADMAAAFVATLPAKKKKTKKK